MSFKVGQGVVFIEKWGKHSIGDKATVVKEAHSFFGKTYIGIRWNVSLTPGRFDDGGYYLSQFKPALQVGEQMEFSFMAD